MVVERSEPVFGAGVGSKRALVGRNPSWGGYIGTTDGDTAEPPEGLSSEPETVTCSEMNLPSAPRSGRRVSSAFRRFCRSIVSSDFEVAASVKLKQSMRRVPIRSGSSTLLGNKFDSPRDIGFNVLT